MIEIKMPQGVSAQVAGDVISIKGKLGSNSRRFNDALLSISIKGDVIAIDHTTLQKLSKNGANSEIAMAKEITNDIKGVDLYYERKMKAVFLHFPINVEVKNNIVHINNIIGERMARKAKIVGATKVDAKGQSLRVYGTSLDDVTQTSANIRLACVMRKKDTRVFQDGLYYEV